MAKKNEFVCFFSAAILLFLHANQKVYYQMFLYVYKKCGLNFIRIGPVLFEIFILPFAHPLIEVFCIVFN